MGTWLLICCALVFAMVVVGGVTRLTHSGLSIVEWEPIVGIVPPLNSSDWDNTFQKYQQTPEYQKLNQGMSLGEFKGIFWLEYFHRLLGRAIGLVFFLPFLYFLIRKKVDRRLGLKLAGIFLLGGLQGVLGWYMVESGLVNDPHVNHLRLTAHLGIALLIYAAILWTGLDLLHPGRTTTNGLPQRLSRYALALVALIFVMSLSGGLVAGTHAGFAYNTFPLMNGHFAPPEIATLSPWYLNIFNNIATIQFDHRIIALLLFIAVPVFWSQARKLAVPQRARLALHLFLLMLLVQITLGISILLLVVPLPLAAAHQGGAVLLLTAALWTAHELRASQEITIYPAAATTGKALP